MDRRIFPQHNYPFWLQQTLSPLWTHSLAVGRRPRLDANLRPVLRENLVRRRR